MSLKALTVGVTDFSVYTGYKEYEDLKDYGKISHYLESCKLHFCQVMVAQCEMCVSVLRDIIMDLKCLQEP